MNASTNVRPPVCPGLIKYDQKMIDRIMYDHHVAYIVRGGHALCGQSFFCRISYSVRRTIYLLANTAGDAYSLE